MLRTGPSKSFDGPSTWCPEIHLKVSGNVCKGFGKACEGIVISSGGYGGDFHHFDFLVGPGNLGTAGSVEFMFDRVCSFKIKTEIDLEELELNLIGVKLGNY